MELRSAGTHPRVEHKICEDRKGYPQSGLRVPTPQLEPKYRLPHSPDMCVNMQVQPLQSQLSALPVLGTPSKAVTVRDVQRVHALIEHCLLRFLTRLQTVCVLESAGIPACFVAIGNEALIRLQQSPSAHLPDD